ncbi:MAG: hypothetical protein EAX96_21270 [Candidatus Lokiarchaeota archaeon]|nr:hypothetical protein [Candidatus Lokiarchaeota archaeon]
MSLTIINFISSIFMMVTGIFSLLALLKLISAYKHKKSRATLIFILAFIFALTGSIILASVSIWITALYSQGVQPSFITELVGRVGLLLGITLSVLGLIFVNIFSFENTFPDKIKILTLIVSISGAVFIYILILAHVNQIFGGDLVVITGTSPLYHINIVLLGYIAILPSTISTPTVFLYSGSKIRSMDVGKSNRSIIFGICFLLLNLGFVFGTLTFGSDFLFVIMSFISSIIVCFSSILIYLCIKMPEWFKNRIKWTDE